MMQHQDPNRDLKLTLGIAASGALALSPMALPSHTLAAVVPSTLAFGGAVASIAKANEYEQADRIEADARERWQALKADMDDAMLVSSQAFYTHNPGAWLEGRNVPARWHTEYLRARFAPLPELQQSLSQPVPHTTSIAPTPPQAAPIQQPGQTRGGSFDIADGFIPQHPDAPPSGGWEIDAIDLSQPVDNGWLDSLLRPSVLLIFGADGSGKTSMARELMHRRGEAGHQVYALDPHAHPGKWGSCQVIGGGMGHKAIAAWIANLQTILKDRYERISSGQVRPGAFQPISVCCEELTDWASEVPNANLLLTKAGHYRKANIHLMLVSHGDKLGQIGAPRGFADMADRILTKLELFSVPGADGEPVPAFKGRLRRPKSEWFPVAVPTFAAAPREPHAPNAEPQTLQGFSSDLGAEVQGSFSDGSSPELHEPTNDRERELLEKFVALKGMGANKELICFSLFGARKGGSAAYKMASDFYDRLNSIYQQSSGGSAA